VVSVTAVRETPDQGSAEGARGARETEEPDHSVAEWYVRASKNDDAVHIAENWAMDNSPSAIRPRSTGCSRTRTSTERSTPA
jgi:hypothetical protein